MTQTSSSLRPNATPVRPTVRSLTPLTLQQVQLNGGFWGDRQTLNTAAIIPHGLAWTDRLGWVQNLESAAARQPYVHRGREFADSEIYKLIEAISWDAARRGADDIDARLDRLLTAIAGAQDPDGYLHTLFGRAWQQPRYSDFKWGHELYCYGHLLQAAVAHHRTTGNDRLLLVARKLGDHVVTMFGPNGIDMVCGHAGIELGLVELYRVTGERRYLDQASVFVERRGRGTLPRFEFGAAFWQDDMPVRAATVLRGHAVRALYLAAGAVDVAVETGDGELLEALETQWRNTVARRTYITGGMGSHHMDEAFGDDFVLPPDRSYCETCAGVASIMFSWRLLLATGEAKYADLIERTLYNVVATSPSAEGTAFFYANTLHQRQEHALPALNDDGVVIRGGASGRQPWYEVSCCPPNVARLLASLGAYIATGDVQGIQIHQYATGRIQSGQTDTTAGATLEVSTDYPSTGIVRVTVIEAPEQGIRVDLRIPSWAIGATLRREDAGTEMSLPRGMGYATVEGLRTGETVLLTLPLDIRRGRADDRVDAVRGCVAFERGPEVFALESVDLPDGWELADVVADVSRPRWVDGRPVIDVAHVGRDSTAPWSIHDADTAPGVHEHAQVQLVPYHSWAERGPSTMRIWIPVATPAGT